MATITKTDTGFDSDNLTTYTFSGKSFGAASTDRKIIVGAWTRDTSSINVVSATIGGVSASVVIDHACTSGSMKSIALLIADVPTGTTGDVVITYNTQSSDCYIIVYATTGLTSSTPTDTSEPASTTLDVMKGGVVVALSENPSTTQSASWSGLTEDLDVLFDSSHDISAASKVIEETTIGFAPVCTWSVSGVGDLIMASFPATVPFTNPGNAYASDDTYATCAATDGEVTVEVSLDGGNSYGTALSKTFTGTEGSQTFGDADTELWGHSPTRADVVDANLRIRVTHGIYSQVYKTFGFTTGTDILTGIEISIEAKYVSSTIFIDLIQVKIYYGTSTLPVQAGSMAYASNGRKAGEGVGSGTGVLCFFDGLSWIACDTGAVVSA